MGVPTSEVGYTIATTRRETTKVHKNMWWHWWGKNTWWLGEAVTFNGFSMVRPEVILVTEQYVYSGYV